MTKEQEDSIEILENTDISTIELAENTDLYTYSLAVRTVLNMLKEKDAEIEKKDKMIDLMAYDLADYVMYYEYDKCRNPVMIKNKAEQLKEYYERKAKDGRL